MTRNWKYTNSALQYFLEIPGIGNENTWSLGDTLTRALYCFGLWEWGRTDGVATPASSSLLTLCLRLWNGYLTKYFKPSLCYHLHGGQAYCSDGPNMRQRRPNLSSPPPARKLLMTGATNSDTATLIVGTSSLPSHRSWQRKSTPHFRMSQTGQTEFCMSSQFPRRGIGE